MNTLNKRTIAVIGVGNIGKILLERLISSGVSGSHLIVCEINEEKANKAALDFGVETRTISDLHLLDVSLILLCVGPKAVLPTIKELTNHLKPDQTLVSFAAAVPISEIVKVAPVGVKVVRIMPNAPSLTGKGMNPVCFSERTDQETRDLIFELLNCLGETLEIPDNLMNSAVGLSGAAIRSVLPTMEGMIRAGIDAGFSEEQARILVSQSFLGVAALVKEGKLPIQELKKLTPMETLTEPLVDQIFYDATAGANEKINALQQKILTENQ